MAEAFSRCAQFLGYPKIGFTETGFDQDTGDGCWRIVAVGEQGVQPVALQRSAQAGQRATVQADALRLWPRSALPGERRLNAGYVGMKRQMFRRQVAEQGIADAEKQRIAGSQ